MPEDAELIHEFAEFLLNNDLEQNEAAALAGRAAEIDPDEPAYRKTYADLLARAFALGGGDRTDSAGD